MHSRTLPSGLRLLVDPTPRADVTALYLWIDVGSSAEGPELHGAAHIVEHMVFKGTASFGVGELAAHVEALGGDINAWTSFDETVFHVTVPAAATDDGVRVLAEMLQSPRFDPDELERERAVICEEIRGGDDDADLVLTEAVYARAFRDHAYARPIIGTYRSVRGISHAALVGFWREHYVPANACLAVAGPVSPEAVEAAAARLFPTSTPAPAPRRAIPAQRRPGFKRLHRRFEANLAEIAWAGPGHGHPDVAALDTLCTALGGGLSAPVERDLRRREPGCVGATMQYEAERDAGLAVLSLHAYPDGMAATLVAADRLLHDASAVSLGDLERAKAQILADRVFRRETVDGRAHELVFHERVFGDPQAGRIYDEQVARLTLADIGLVADRWLRPERAVTVVLSREAVTPPPPSARVLPVRAGATGVRRVRLDNGVRLLLEPDDGEVVAVRAVGLGGQLGEAPRTAGALAMWARLVGRDADGLGPVAYARALEGLGTQIGGVAGRSSVGLKMDVAAPHFGEALELLLLSLLSPTFAADEVDRARNELREALRERDDHPEARIVEELWARVAPDHPWGLPPLGTRASLRNIGPTTLRKLHERWLRGPNLVVAVTGRFDPERVEGRLRRALGRLPADFVHPHPTAPTWTHGAWTLEGPQEQTHVAAAYPAVGVAHPESPTLDVLANVLGGQGGRLFHDLREKRGLAYAVSASVQDGLHPGLVVLGLGTDPGREAEAVAALREALRAVVDGGISAEEVERAKAWVRGAAATDRQTAGGRAGEAAWAEVYGLDGAEYRSLVRRVDDVDVERVRRLAAACFATPVAEVVLRPPGGA